MKTRFYKLDPIPGLPYVNQDGMPTEGKTYYVMQQGEKLLNMTEKQLRCYRTAEEASEAFQQIATAYRVTKLNALHLVLKHKWYHAIESEGKREEYRENTPHWRARLMHGNVYKDFDLVVFHDGYTDIIQVFFHYATGIGLGKPEWGAPEHGTFIIHLGEKLW